MDKRDFYREIMEQYAFDKDKIYANAKSGKYIGNKRRQPYPLYIGMTAAVAAVVVTVSALTSSWIGKTPDVIKTLPKDASATSLPDSEVNSETEDNNPTVSESVPTDSASDDTSGRVAPIITDSGSTADTSGESSRTTDNNTNSNSVPAIGTSSTEITESSTGTESSSSTTLESSVPETDTSSTDVPVEPVIGNHTKNITGVTAVFPTNISLPKDSIPSISTEMLIALPDNAELPFNPDRFSYLSEDIGAQQAYFLNDDTVYVRTADEMRLYTMKDDALALIASQSCADAVTFWIAENGGRQLAFDNGKLYDINAQSGTITENTLNIGGEITEIAYNEDTGLLVLNVFDSGNYSLIAFENGFTEPETLYSSTEPFSLIAATAEIGGIGNVGVFIGASSEEELLIYRAAPNEDASVISTVRGKYNITRNSAFTHAVLRGEITDMLFDPNSFGILNLDSSDIRFGVSKHTYLCRDGYFTVNNGGIAPGGSVSDIAPLDFTRSFSQNYMAAAENGTVRVVGGVYTKRARNDALTFVAPEETSSAAMRMAVNAAVGLQNTLGGGLCEELGIVDTETLDRLINTCFTESAGAMLKLRCSVGEGEALTYKSGIPGLINLSDTVLVISEETETTANGTLYVKAGDFGGKTGYYSCAVKLQKTESGYAADCIIE